VVRRKRKLLGRGFGRRKSRKQKETCSSKGKTWGCKESFKKKEDRKWEENIIIEQLKE